MNIICNLLPVTIHYFSFTTHATDGYDVTEQVRGERNTNQRILRNTRIGCKMS